MALGIFTTIGVQRVRLACCQLPHLSHVFTSCRMLYDVPGGAMCFFGICATLLMCITRAGNFTESKASSPTTRKRRLRDFFVHDIASEQAVADARRALKRKERRERKNHRASTMISIESSDSDYDSSFFDDDDDDDDRYETSPTLSASSSTIDADTLEFVDGSDDMEDDRGGVQEKVTVRNKRATIVFYLQRAGVMLGATFAVWVSRTWDTWSSCVAQV